MSAARDAVLGALRAGLRTTNVPPLPPVGTGREVPVAARVERFTAMLTKIGGRVELVPDLGAATARVQAIFAAAGVQRIALSDAPEVAAIAAALPATTTVLPAAAPRDALLDADAGLTCAQWGIAATGTLVLASSREQHRLASLLPPLHVVVLPVSRLLGTLADVFATLPDANGRPLARTVTFVTGPSRTADIELTLVVGVHGPKLLHVVLVDGA